MAVVERFYPKWKKENRSDLINELHIRETIQQTNQERGQWAASLFHLWRDSSLVSRFLQEF